MKAKLDPRIVVYLARKLEKAPLTISKDISLLKRKHPKCTSNAVAHIYAQQNGISVLNKMNKEDKESLPHLEIDKSRIKITQKKHIQKEKIVNFINYPTSEHFKLGHINELNRAYTNRCYTSVYILFRKILENLIREILSKKFPSNNRENRELYYDTVQRRFKDFSVILKNLFDKRNEFDVEKIEVIDRLYDRAKKLKMMRMTKHILGII